ncbi:MAG: hypothetical protein JXQ90_16570 [Cyclobacteriaceae bacterium]
MKTRLILLATPILFSSCIFSLFPIYTKETLVNLPELEGQWENSSELIWISSLSTFEITGIEIEPGEDEFIVIEGDTIRDKNEIIAYWKQELQNEIDSYADKKIEGYLMTQIDKSSHDTLKFKLHVAKIGEAHYADFYPVEEGDGYQMFAAQNFLAVHTFSKIKVSESGLEFTSFDAEKLLDAFKANKIRLRHEMRTDEEVLITAKPEEIQKFIRTYSKNSDVFDSPSVYTRSTQAD